ncbi:hypothetical protein B296_00003348 [Ensete ventricosum]|uniref:Uncharacterized protein n=1 Tax=Ensete ventricosum TaxID=4639 RepID=A0A427AAH1_ENSVE|nr:hypothetical protein B296_00003348 [Ensete ventricosum]
MIHNSTLAYINYIVLRIIFSNESAIFLDQISDLNGSSGARLGTRTRRGQSTSCVDQVARFNEAPPRRSPEPGERPVQLSELNQTSKSGSFLPLSRERITSSSATDRRPLQLSPLPPLLSAASAVAAATVHSFHHCRHDCPLLSSLLPSLSAASAVAAATAVCSFHRCRCCCLHLLPLLSASSAVAAVAVRSFRRCCLQLPSCDCYCLQLLPLPLVLSAASATAAVVRSITTTVLN